jgi:hypothetical protein
VHHNISPHERHSFPKSQGAQKLRQALRGFPGVTNGECRKAISNNHKHCTGDSSLLCTNQCSAIKDRLDRIELVGETLRQESIDKLRRLTQTVDLKSDSILFFHYQTGEREELGYWVISGNKLKRRHVFGDRL